MADTYSAIYEAVRSRISGGDIGGVVREVMRDAFDISYIKALAQEAVSIASYEYTRPSSIYRPKLYMEGDKWYAVHGHDNFIFKGTVRGVTGCGNSPAEAYADFDREWNKKIASTD